MHKTRNVVSFGMASAPCFYHHVQTDAHDAGTINAGPFTVFCAATAAAADNDE